MFGAALEGALLRSCGGRLRDLRWFRTDWQRGGALTGNAIWRDGAGRDHACVVKLPIPPNELTWLERLQSGAGDRAEAGGEGEGAGGSVERRQVVPVLHTGGRELGQYDLAWAVMERLPHGPLDGKWGGAEWGLLADAAARFAAAAGAHEVDREPRREDWDATAGRAREAVKTNGLPEGQRWNVALKGFAKLWKKRRGEWEGRDWRQWCHGDLHLGNAMCRTAAPGGPAVLFDLALVHAGHWVEDAVYVEHVYWGAPGRMGGQDIVKMIARARRGLGLAEEGDWPRLAELRRGCLAAAAPARIATSHNLNYLHAALERLEGVNEKLG